MRDDVIYLVVGMSQSPFVGVSFQSRVLDGTLAFPTL